MAVAFWQKQGFDLREFMHDEFKQKLVNLLDEACRKVGAPSYEEGFSTVATLFEKLAAQTRAIDTREKLLALIKDWDVSRQERLMVLSAVHHLPNIVRIVTGKLAAEVKADFPPEPAGRPEV